MRLSWLMAPDFLSPMGMGPTSCGNFSEIHRKQIMQMYGELVQNETTGEWSLLVTMAT